MTRARKGSYGTLVVDENGKSLVGSFALLNDPAFACTTGVWCLLTVTEVSGHFGGLDGLEEKLAFEDFGGE